MQNYGRTIADKKIKLSLSKKLITSMNKILINTLKGFTEFFRKQTRPVIVHGDSFEPLACDGIVLRNVKIAT